MRVCRCEAFCLVCALERSNDGIERAIENLVKVVGLKSTAVIRDAVLREIVGTDTLGSVDGAHLGKTLCGGFSLTLGFGFETTSPEGRRVIRTAESVVFTA